MINSNDNRNSIPSSAIKDNGKQPVTKYKFQVKNVIYEVSEPIILGRQILTTAGLTPEKHILHQKLPSNQYKEIGLDEEVDLSISPGIDKFTYISKGVIDG